MSLFHFAHPAPSVLPFFPQHQTQQLEDNGSFSSKCTEEEQAEEIVCDQQRAMFMRLGLLIPSMQLFSPVIGIVVDKCGPKITAYLQGVCCIAGLLIIITGSSTQKDPLLFVGFAIIAINVWMGSQLILQLGLYFSGTLQIHPPFPSSILSIWIQTEFFPNFFQPFGRHLHIS